MELTELKQKAQEALEAGELETAKELMEQIKELKAQEEQRNELAEELRALDTEIVEEEKEEVVAEEAPTEEAEETEVAEEVAEVEEEEKEEREERSLQTKGDETQMKEILGQAHAGVQDFEGFIRSEGKEVRSLDTTSGAVLVPVEVSTSVLELKDGQTDLSKYITVENVGTGSGKFPVAKRARAILATKAELAEIAEVTDPLFLEVDYKVETRIGQIAFSNELIEDSEIDVVGYAQKQMKRMVTNTNNKGVIDIIKAFGAVKAEGADGIKNVVNIQLDPELDVKFIVNQDAYNYLDTLKDLQGRYLLQDNISVDSGKSLFGREVIVVSNLVAPTPKGSEGFMFAGDLKEAVFMAKRKEITAEWEKFDRYSKGLAVGIRSDYKAIDASAGHMITVTKAVAG